MHLLSICKKTKQKGDVYEGAAVIQELRQKNKTIRNNKNTWKKPTEEKIMKDGFISCIFLNDWLKMVILLIFIV